MKNKCSANNIATKSDEQSLLVTVRVCCSAWSLTCANIVSVLCHSLNI